jgi:hypothetical protein
LRRSLKPHFGPALFLALAFTILVSFVWLGGYPVGTDAWGHMVRAEYVAGQIRQSGWTALFDTAWMPTWYMGDPVRTYYPPLTNVLLSPLAVVIQNPALLHHLFTSAILGIFAVATYAFVQNVWSPWTGSLAAILAIWAPYQLRTVFFEGNYPRALALLALPILAWGTELILRTGGRKVPFILLLSGGWVWAILAHPQQALMFAIGFCIYLIARLFLDPDVQLRAAGAWLIGLAAGGLLTMPWALPAYSRAELTQVPYLPAEKVDLFTAPIRSVLPASDMSNGTILVGFGLLCLSILSIAARPDPRRVAYTIAGLVAMWFAFGPSAVAFSLLPLNQQLLPERFLNFTSFAFAISAAGLIPFKHRARIARAFILLGFVFIDVFPGLSLLVGRPFPYEQAALASVACEVEEAPCRAALLTYPDPNALEVYFAGQGVNLINGWGLENTPHNRAIRRLLSSPTWSVGYFQKLISQWDVGVAPVRGIGAEAAEEALQKAGYHFALEVGDYDLWIDIDPPSPVQALPNRRMLLVGDMLPPMIMAFPFAEEATVTSLASIPSQTLDAHPALGLMNFAASTGEVQEALDRLQEYLDNGGVAVVELSGMEEAFGKSIDFVDVGVIRLSLQDDVRVRWREGLRGLPENLRFSRVSPEGWSGATYLGLDEVVAEIEFQGSWYPIMGYNDVGDGRVWFMGMNLLYYAQLSEATDIVDAVRAWTLDDVDLSTALQYDPVHLESWETTAQGLRFQATTESAVPEALVSYTYSPRWRVTVDGSEVNHGVYENLIKLSLPAGSHQVDIRYRPYGTPWPIAGLVIGMISAMVLAAGYIVERRRFVPLEDQPERVETDLDEEFAPCANCGFLLAKVGPPTSTTYPFQVVNCPICGLQMDDEGFHPGAELSEEERIVALSKWLKQYEYEPEIVHDRWGFGPERFFGEPSQVPLPEASDAQADISDDE